MVNIKLTIRQTMVDRTIHSRLGNNNSTENWRTPVHRKDEQFLHH